MRLIDADALTDRVENSKLEHKAKIMSLIENCQTIVPPVKPMTNCDHYDNGMYRGWWYICPRCKEAIDYKQEECKKCYQKIDWT